MNPSNTPLPSQYFPAKPQDHPEDDDQEEGAHKGVSLEDGQPAAGERSEHVEHAHRQGELVKNVAGGGEVDHCRNVRGEIDHLGAGRRGQKVEAKQANKNEDQKAARPRPEKAVVKPDRHSHQNAKLALAMGGELRRMEVAQILAPKGVGGHADHQDQDQRLQRWRLDPRDCPRAKKRKHQRRKTSRHHQTPRDPDMPRILNHGHACAADGGKFVRAEYARHRFRQRVGQENEKRRQLNQAATADHRIHKPSQKGKQAKAINFHSDTLERLDRSDVQARRR